MRSNHTVFVALIAILLLSVEAFTAPSATQPTTQLRLATPADLKEMHDAGEYRTCLQQIAHILSFSPQVTRDYHKFTLLLLRGDCLLHLGDRVTAYDAYSEAEKSPDHTQAAAARATALLIQSSAGLAYTPPNPPGAAPIEIVDHEKRKAAMLALMNQERADRKAVIDAALDAKTLVPILDATPTFMDLYDLEVTATGADSQIHPMLVAVGERARELMSTELKTIDQRIGVIEHVANQKLAMGGSWWWGTLTRQGLTTDNRAALRRDIEYTDKITTAANHFQHLSQKLGGTGEKWRPVIEQAMQVAQHGRDVLMAE